ncbi:MAG: hypothetical protein AB8U91_00925 [Candidatus Midichloria sp.]
MIKIRRLKSSITVSSSTETVLAPTLTVTILGLASILKSITATA